TPPGRWSIATPSPSRDLQTLDPLTGHGKGVTEFYRTAREVARHAARNDYPAITFHDAKDFDGRLVLLAHFNGPFADRSDASVFPLFVLDHGSFAEARSHRGDVLSVDRCDVVCD